MTAACPCFVIQASAVVDFTKGSRADFSHRTSIWPVVALIRFLSILRIPYNFFLMSLSFTLFSQAICGYPGGPCKIFLLLYSPCTLPSLFFLNAYLFLSFIPFPHFSFHIFFISLFICSCFITLHGLLCVRVPPLFPSLPFFLSDCLSGIIALPQIAVLAGQKYSLHLCHKRQKIGVFRGRVEGAVLSYLAWTASMGSEASLRPLGTGFYIQARMAHTGCILVCGSMLCIMRNLSFITSTHQDPPTQTDSKHPNPLIQ